LTWGRHECKRQDLSPTPDNVRAVLRDIIQYVRFPLMKLEDVASKVQPEQVLEDEQLLQIFTYLGAPREAKPNLVGFNPNPRSPRVGISKMAWDPNKKNASLVLSDSNLVAKSFDNNSWRCVYGDKVFTDGVHCWEVHLLQCDTANAYNVMVGVVPANDASYVNQHIGIYNAPGWVLCSSSGTIACVSKGSNPVSFTSAITGGQQVGCRLDCNKQTLEFFKNGRRIGTAFTDIHPPVRAAICLIGYNTIRLISNPSWARNA